MTRQDSTHRSPRDGSVDHAAKGSGSRWPGGGGRRGRDEPAWQAGNEAGLAVEADRAVGDGLGPRTVAVGDRVQVGRIGLDINVPLLAQLRVVEAQLGGGPLRHEQPGSERLAVAADRHLDRDLSLGRRLGDHPMPKPPHDDRRVALRHHRILRHPVLRPLPEGHQRRDELLAGRGETVRRQPGRDRWIAHFVARHAQDLARGRERQERAGRGLREVEHRPLVRQQVDQEPLPIV